MTKSEAQNGAVWCDVVAEVVELPCGAERCKGAAFLAQSGEE